jgi:hypothetical protein
VRSRNQHRLGFRAFLCNLLFLGRAVTPGFRSKPFLGIRARVLRRVHGAWGAATIPGTGLRFLVPHNALLFGGAESAKLCAQPFFCVRRRRLDSSPFTLALEL